MGKESGGFLDKPCLQATDEGGARLLRVGDPGRNRLERQLLGAGVVA